MRSECLHLMLRLPPGQWAITGVIITVISTPTWSSHTARQQGEQLRAGNRPSQSVSQNVSRKGRRSLDGGLNFSANIENLPPSGRGRGGRGESKQELVKISDCPSERLYYVDRGGLFCPGVAGLSWEEYKMKAEVKMFYDKITTTTAETVWERPTQLNILKFLQSDWVRPIQLFGKDKMGLLSLQSVSSPQSPCCEWIEKI